MLLQLSDRGPDSAGVAFYRDPVGDGWCKVSLYSADPEQDCDNESAKIPARHNELGDRTGNESDDDRPKESKHMRNSAPCFDAADLTTSLVVAGTVHKGTTKHSIFCLRHT